MRKYSELTHDMSESFSFKSCVFQSASEVVIFSPETMDVMLCDHHVLSIVEWIQQGKSRVPESLKALYTPPQLEQTLRRLEASRIIQRRTE